MHGANRLGGNSLSDLLVFGKLSGASACAFAKKNGAVKINEADIKAGMDEMLAPLSRTDGPTAYEVHEKLQDLMQTYVGIMRIEADLKHALEELAKLKQEAQRIRVTGSRIYNPGWHLAYDITTMLNTSEATARCALQRTESRGAHTRLDFPATSADWGKVNSTVNKDGDGMKIGTSPLPQMPEELKKLFEEPEKK
jgi:succinate dehydrogenase / fumarate reductase flavoprotein subunit